MKKLLLLITTVIFLNTGYSQAVKGKIYYDLGYSKKKIGSGLVIYLIPNNTQNASIVSSISRDKVSCNEKLIKTARNYKVAITDKAGYYFFNNITPGAYLLKICTYYGGYYQFTIKTSFTGTLSLPDFEADPSIK
jgi:cell division protein YceG involved in septum cleavage